MSLQGDRRLSHGHGAWAHVGTSKFLLLAFAPPAEHHTTPNVRLPQSYVERPGLLHYKRSSGAGIP